MARRHLSQGTLVLYDVSSTDFEGRGCPLARHGDSRNKLVCGLLCASDGCQVAVEVFEGNVADPATLGVQVEKLRQRFRIETDPWPTSPPRSAAGSRARAHE